MTINNIAWTFTNECFTDSVKFNSEVAQYQKDIYEDTGLWKPDEIIFDFSELQIQYTAWVSGPSDLLDNELLTADDIEIFEEEPEEEEYQVEIIAKLKADNGKNFTALEFLMKVHNQQANKDLGDHVFFEGTDETPEIVDGIPTYYIACGS